MQTVLVSACLLGIPCRWHGRSVRPSAQVRKFITDHPEVEIVPVCPEELGGLPTPRPPVKTRRGHVFETCADKAKRDEVTGAEVTEYFVAGANATLAIARKHDCRLAILCRNSPSCAKTGITGKLLAQHGIEIVNTF
jgi:uncharacterized protein YbbK (DUF523 family)